MKISPAKDLLRSPLAFSVLTAVLLVSLYNWRFWSETIAATQPISLENAIFLASLFAILVFVHAAILILIPGTILLRAVTAIGFLAAAAAAFFTDSYGVILDKEMFRNLFETDTREASDFFTPRFAAYLFLLGVVPAMFALRVKLVVPPLRQRLMYGGMFLTVGFLCASLLFANLSHFLYFFNTHKPLIRLLNPSRPIAGLVSYLSSSELSDAAAFVADPESNAQMLPEAKAPKPLLLFLVVGETARADHFQLGGYGRPTNPELLRTEGVHYFANAVSCGTSTAVSVPCIFSPQEREHFNIGTARRHSNLLDALRSAGFDVEWRENNSSSKGVATRFRMIDFIHQAKSRGCVHDPCYDEEMLQGLTEHLRGLRQNMVIVFHEMGSHGPAYWQRYPPRFEIFKPTCKIAELWDCDRESLVNSYDNTILYTDHVLAEQIRLLQTLSSAFDSLLIYISDHGESLGEHGLYLHGAPYVLAPEEQTNVPYLIWMSEGYRKRFAIRDDCLRRQHHRRVRHDNVYHTVLGALGLRNGFYKPHLDMIGVCAAYRGHV